MNYDEWNEVKKNTNKSKEKAVKLGKVYWVRLGLNIGSEVYGKGKNYVRPVLVLKIVYKNSFIGVPLSTKAKKIIAFHTFIAFILKIMILERLCYLK